MKKRALLFTSLLIILLIILILIFQNRTTKCNEPIVTFAFDDGYNDQYVVAFPIFKEYNLTATSYIITGLVGGYFENETLMNWKEIKELRENGWEIGSHTVMHRDLTKLNKESIKEELEISKLRLEEQGFIIKSLSIPYGKYNEEIKEISKNYYESVRPSDLGLNKFSKIDRYNLKSFWLTNSTPLSEIKSWVDEAENNNSWTIIMVHHVRTNLSREYATHPNDIIEVIKYIKEKNITVKTVSEVLDQCG